MCTGGEIGSLFGAKKGADEGLRAAERANVIKERPDPNQIAATAAVERQAAEQRAADLSGLRIRMQRQAMRQNSLLTGGGGGRTTLGV